MHMIIFLHWLLTSFLILAIASILPGVNVEGFLAAFAASVILGLINAFLRPLFILLTLPINILTLGIFTFVINAFFILFTSWIVPGFEVQNFWWALLFSLILSLANILIRGQTGTRIIIRREKGEW